MALGLTNREVYPMSDTLVPRLLVNTHLAESWFKRPTGSSELPLTRSWSSTAVPAQIFVLASVMTSNPPATRHLQLACKFTAAAPNCCSGVRQESTDQASASARDVDGTCDEGAYTGAWRR